MAQMRTSKRKSVRRWGFGRFVVRSHRYLKKGSGTTSTLLPGGLIPPLSNS
jgi:hypothetical protein